MLRALVVLSAVGLDDQPPVDQEIDPTCSDHLRLCTHIPAEPSKAQPGQRLEPAVRVRTRERDEVPTRPIQCAAQPAQRASRQQPPPSSGLEGDEEGLGAAASVDLQQDPSDRRQREGRGRRSGIPMTDAVAVRARSRSVVPVPAEPHMRQGVVQNPDAEMSGSGLATERSAVRGGLDGTRASRGRRVHPPPDSTELAATEPSLDRPARRVLTELTPRPDLDPGTHAHRHSVHARGIRRAHDHRRSCSTPSRPRMWRPSPSPPRRPMPGTASGQDDETPCDPRIARRVRAEVRNCARWTVPGGTGPARPTPGIGSPDRRMLIRSGPRRSPRSPAPTAS